MANAVPVLAVIMGPDHIPLPRQVFREPTVSFTVLRHAVKDLKTRLNLTFWSPHSDLNGTPMHPLNLLYLFHLIPASSTLR